MFRVNETKCMFSSKEILRILDCKACEVKDFEITEVSVDSRSVNKPESTLFFALKGINHDGHDYVEKLYEQGVRNFVVTGLRAGFLPLSGANFFVVDEVLPALQQLAAWFRGQMKAEVVGITGSNGKTIVKEWLYQLLSDEPGIYRSPRSYNSQVGVPLSLLASSVIPGIFGIGLSCQLLGTLIGGNLPNYPTCFFLLLIGLALSLFSYFIIETPIRKKAITKKLTISLSICVFCCTLLVVQSINTLSIK